VQSHAVALIPGDGIGPEVTVAVQQIFETAEAPIAWEVHQAGIAALETSDTVLPQTTIDAIKHHGVALKGPCTTPVGKGFSSVNVQLRKKLNLYAAVRPVRSLEGVPTRFDNVDLVIVRENTEGLYSGIENRVTDDAVMTMKVTTESACLRIARWAFEFASRTKRKSLTVFHKANIMKMTDGLFLDCSRRVHEDFGNIEYKEAIIDAGCMKLVQDPLQYDVLLLQNLYGDVVSDLAAGLVGGLGVVPGSNFGDNLAMFEAVHGTAPDIAGKGVANPLALLMSGVMLLEHLAKLRNDDTCAATADRITKAYKRSLAEGEKTRDLGGKLDTKGFVAAVIERLSD